MANCTKVEDVISNGVWQGDIPIHFALPRLIIQLSIVLLVTRSLACLFKPLRQPRVIAEVVGGVLLGPTALGHFHAFTSTIFPKRSLTILDTVANIGLLFFLFIVGLELDLNDIRRSGRKAFIIAIAGISVPFIAGIGMASLVRDTISKGVDFAPLLIFMGVPICITAFPVLVRILAERKLLATEVGRIVLPAAAINDVCAWILLALGVAMAGSHNSPLTPLWVLLSGIVFVVFMLFCTRRFMSWLVHCTTMNKDQHVSEIYVCITMAGVLISGFTTDAIGLHPLFGAFMFGLIVPKEGRFAELVTQKIEDFVTVLMLPLFFASSGLKTDLTTINSVKSFGFLLLLLATAACGKMGATWVSAIAQGTDKKVAATVGVLMNTKGLVELIILNIGKDVKVLNDQTFAILVLMCLLTTFIVTPLVIAIYKPAPTHIPYAIRNIESIACKEELHILACIQGSRTISPIVNFLELARGTKKSPTKPYILQFIELSQRPSSLIVANKAAKVPTTLVTDNILATFEACGELSKVKLKSKIVVSEFESMHEDICRAAEEQQSVFILLPYHKSHRGDGELEIIHPLLKKVNQKVLQHAPCSVGIIIDRGADRLVFSGPESSRRIAVLFFGGRDDREALALGCYLTGHPGVSLTIIRFLPELQQPNNVVIDFGSSNLSNLEPRGRRISGGSHDHRPPASVIDVEKEKVLDQECLDSVCKQQDGDTLIYQELKTNKAIEEVMAIATTNRFNMILVGRGQHEASPLIAALGMRVAPECMELGPIGGVLAEVVSMEASVLIVQQYDSRTTPIKLDDDEIVNSKLP